VAAGAGDCRQRQHAVRLQGGEPAASTAELVTRPTRLGSGGRFFFRHCWQDASTQQRWGRAQLDAECLAGTGDSGKNRAEEVFHARHRRSRKSAEARPATRKTSANDSSSPRTGASTSPKTACRI